MNLFKNVLKVTMGLSLLIMFGCEKDHISKGDNSLTDEIEKLDYKSRT